MQQPGLPMTTPARIRRILWTAGFFLLSPLCSGCVSSLPKDLIALDAPEACPALTAAQIAENSTLFHDTTATATLHCALDLLRNAKRVSLHESSAGAKICFLLADRTETDRAQREGFAAEGVRWAERALAQGGKENGDVYYYLAVNLGIAVEEHPVAALKHLDRLVASLDKALALSPDVHSAGPYRVLGMVYLMAPPWPQGMGDVDKALELLQEAVRRFPAYPLNQIFYARALREAEGGEQEERITRCLEEALRLINQEQWLAVRKRWLAELDAVAGEAHISLPGRTQF